MKIDSTRGALGMALWALVTWPAFAQHDGQQMPGPGASAAPASPTSCAQSSQGVTRGIDALGARIDEARQTNDAAKMRAALGDLQVALAQMKNQLADCSALTQSGSAMGSMGAMEHSKMQMAPGMPAMQPGSTVSAADAKTATPMAGMDRSKMQIAPKAGMASGSSASAPGAKTAAPMTGMDHSKTAGTPPAKKTRTEQPKMAGMDHSKMAGEKAAPTAAATSSKAAQAVVFTLRTEPAPPRSGKNDFEVTLKDAAGKPIADAEVSLAFYLPPRASMNMPEMRNTVKLTSAGNGIYKGGGTLGMPGDWDVTVTALRNGQPLDVKKVKLTAK